MCTFMSYIWRNRLFIQNKPTTTNGDEIQIINPGENTPGDGNIFRNARLRIGGKTWSGNIVLHDKSSEWEQDIQREGAAAYCNVILHVTRNDDVETMFPHGEYIPQLRLQYPGELAQEYENSIREKRLLPCTHTIMEMDALNLQSCLSRLLVERIEEKAERIARIYAECEKRWDDTLFKLLARNFGFGIQSSIFEAWATVLDMQALGKHRDNPTQIEAIFFGQAGLLDAKHIPQYYKEEALASNYYNSLLREYEFLSNKFKLKNIDGSIWGHGNGTPHLRIARLATLYSKERVSISRIAECNTIEELRTLLQAQPDGYWRYHLQFGGTETTGAAPLRNSQLDLLIINTVVPILYSYGKHRHDSTLCNKAEDYLYSLRKEDNSIIRRWIQNGMAINCAADSQAVMQLQKAYCDKSNCRNCAFAYAYLKRRMGA